MLLTIAQIVGVTAVVLYLLSFQLKRRHHIILVTCVSNFLYVLQYFLLGAFSGAVMDILSTVSSVFAGKKSEPSFRRYAKYVAFAMAVLIFGMGLFFALTRKNGIELLPMVGALLQTGGLWFDNEQTIRKFALAGTPFWLVYNFLTRAYGAAFGSVLTMISIIVSLIRYDKAV